MTDQVNRRGFLSLLLAAPVAVGFIKQTPVSSEVLRALHAPFAQRELVRWHMGFSPDAGFDRIVQPGCVTRVIAHSQNVFRPERLAIAGNVASSFDLLNLSAAGEPQLEESLPAELFTAVAIDIRMAFDIVTPGERIVIAAYNHSKEPQPFLAAMIGVCPGERRVIDMPVMPPPEGWGSDDDELDDLDDELIGDGMFDDPPEADDDV